MDDQIQSLAESILDQNPDPVVKYRLLRDVIHVLTGDPELSWVKKELNQNRWVDELAAEQ